MRHQLIFTYLDKVARSGSIRRAAEELNITPSALNRRILALEKELGVNIFERHSTGVRPNIAGEIFLQHARGQIADLEDVKSRIADLSGLRRGHVKIACTAEIIRYFLPTQIQKYRTQFPAVTFDISVYTRGDAENSLADLSSDIALVFEPIKLTDFQNVISVQQPLYCIMSTDHPFATKDTLRLYECVEYPLLLPKRPAGIRQVLDLASAKMGCPLEPFIESNGLDLLNIMSRESDSLSFSIAINLEALQATGQYAAVPIDTRDVAGGFLFAGHLKNRTLSVAAARFLEDITKDLAEQFG